VVQETSPRTFISMAAAYEHGAAAFRPYRTSPERLWWPKQPPPDEIVTGGVQKLRASGLKLQWSEHRSELPNRMLR
jgi:hypothetical protein